MVGIIALELISRTTDALILAKGMDDYQRMLSFCERMEKHIRELKSELNKKL